MPEARKFVFPRPDGRVVGMEEGAGEKGGFVERMPEGKDVVGEIEGDGEMGKGIEGRER